MIENEQQVYIERVKTEVDSYFSESKVRQSYEEMDTSELLKERDVLSANILGRAFENFAEVFSTVPKITRGGKAKPCHFTRDVLAESEKRRLNILEAVLGARESCQLSR